MIIRSLLISATLCTICLVSAYWHYKENKRLSIERPDIIHFAWWRTIQLLAVLGTYSLIIIGYDWKTTSLQRQLLPLQQSQQVISGRTTQILPNTISPPPEASAQAKPIATGISNTTPLQDVYNPESSAVEPPSVMDAIKKRYEEILITHFFLRKCNLALPLDYHIIISSLSQEMSSINAPGRLQYDIVTAAQGSYKEMYSKSTCTSDSVRNLQTQYTDYINSLSRNVITQQ